MDAGPGRPTRVALTLLAGYQRWLSPLLPGACRFWPTCSEYARLVLLRHGLVRGGGLALWRLCRCHRFACGGAAPPPLEKGPKPPARPHALTGQTDLASLVHQTRRP
jgi:putative membrane protein insertion efficiency factor